MNSVLYRMCRDAGVPQLHWHQLRHTFAHSWQMADGNEGDLMAIAGWRSRAMLDRYAKSARAQRAHALAPAAVSGGPRLSTGELGGRSRKDSP